MTHASRNTTTGLIFENKIQIQDRGANLTKHNLYKYLKENNIDWERLLSRKLLPDEAYFDGETFVIYEKKFQQTEGSADEKIQTCGFKISQYRKIGKAIGAKNVKYIYILGDWFKQKKYRDSLDYIRTVPDCDYYFVEDINGIK